MTLSEVQRVSYEHAQDDSRIGRALNLDRDGRRAFAASATGWGLDAFDWTMFSFAVPAIIATLHVTTAQAGYISAASLVASALGGILGGVLADRYGRVRVLVWIIVGFSIFTGLSATAQNLEQLMLWRVLLGLSYGAEWAVGAALLSEYSRPEKRGWLMGMVQSFYAVGWACSTLVYFIAFAVFPETSAWRVMFAVGILPAFVSLWIRRSARDRVDVRPQARTRNTIKLLFVDGRAKTTVLATILGTGVQGIYYSVIIFLPLYLADEQGLGVVGTAGYTWCVIAGAWVGYLVAGYLHDAVGRRPAFTVMFIGSGLSVIFFVSVPLSGVALGLLASFILGFFSSGQVTGMGPFLAELFPTSIRATGQGFCYNWGRALAAAAPAGVGALAAAIGLGDAILTVGLIASAIAVLTTWLLPETQGKEIVAGE